MASSWPPWAFLRAAGCGRRTSPRGLRGRSQLPGLAAVAGAWSGAAMLRGRSGHSIPHPPPQGAGTLRRHPASVVRGSTAASLCGHALRPRRPRLSTWSRSKQRVLDRWRDETSSPSPPRPRKDGRAVDLLRGPAHRQRPARAAPRVGPGVQGPLPPLPDDAGPQRAPQGRLGLPRPAGRARGREGARPPHQARDRGLRHRRVQPALPRVGAPLRRGLVGAHRAVRHVDRHRRRLLDARQRLHRVGLVAASASSGTRACSTRATGSSPYCARCGTALSSHEVGQPGVYRDVVDPSVYVRFPRRRRPPTSTSSCGRPRRGR